MLVPDHKRRVAGPAPITFVPQVQAHMDTYIEHVRPQFISSVVGALFLTSDGTPFTKATISRRLPQFEKAWGSRGPTRDSH